MFNIAICDDEMVICSNIEKNILDYAKKIGEKFKVQVYYSGEKLYEDLENGCYFDLIFLDIELKLINGVEVGRKIRENIKNQDVQIIYMSAYSSYAMELFKIRPMDFLLKPLCSETIEKSVEKGMELLGESVKIFSYKQGRENQKKPMKDILYFKSMNREIEMVTVSGKEFFYGSLEQIYIELKKYRFFYAHKSYLINYSHVMEAHYERLIMSNKVEIPIGQTRRKIVREIQKEFAMEGL